MICKTAGGLLAAFLILELSALADDRQRPQSPRLLFSGIVALPEATARSAAGRAPADRRGQRDWAAAAALRIVQAYSAGGYLFARAWYRLECDGSIRIHVDEGRMRVVFTGAGNVGAFFFRVGLNMPNDVFHRPTLIRALADLKRKHKLLNIYYRVKEPGELEVTPFNAAVPQRVLQIYVVTTEMAGWSFEIMLSSTWGLLPGVGYERHLFWADDRFRAKVEVGFPFRRYLFEEGPRLQWVRGGLELSYRFPPFLHKLLAPRIDTSFYVSHYDRGDLDIKSYFNLRSTTLGNLVLLLPPFELAAGAGVDLMRVFQVELAPDAPTPGLSDDTLSVRGLVRLDARVTSGSDALRRDFRSFAALRFDVASSNIRSWLVDGEVSGQLFFHVNRHRWIVRARGLFLAGDVRFWDEVPLAGDYQRVFFDNRFWVRHAIQLETAYRVNTWWESIDVGLFHDLSVFPDRTRPDQPFSVANAFGPSLHVLLFDLFALDVFVGFGFAPTVGFGTSVSFSMQTVF